MIDDRVVENSVDRRRQAVTAVAGPRSARRMNGDMRVVNTSMANKMFAMCDSQKAKKIESGEYYAKQQLVRYGFLSSHGNRSS